MSSVIVGQNLLDSLGLSIRRARLSGSIFLISDRNVYPIYGKPACSALEDASFRVHSYQVPAGEASKSVEQAWALYDWLIDHRAERQDVVVALGGGVVGDLAGYVAATYLRGVPLVQVPTSLLAQVDSSVGGKVAINHPKAKNLIGAFYQPRLVLVDTALLSTLPVRELRSGWGEVIKTALVLDAELLEYLERNVALLLSAEPTATAHAIDSCLQLKGQVVAEDEREQGRRIILNFGHTIAHGLEAATGYERFLHGEAVAIGMVGAARLSQRLGLLSPEVVERLELLHLSYGLPICAPGVDVDKVLAAMRLDKKSRDKAVRWVLLGGVADVRVVSTVFPRLVSEVLGELVSGD